MIVTKSKSKLVTAIIHISIWAVFGTIYFFQPLTWNISVPYQLWIKQGITLDLVIVAYYVNSLVLVPKFLLSNRNSIYILITRSRRGTYSFIEQLYRPGGLNLPQLMECGLP